MFQTTNQKHMTSPFLLAHRSLQRWRFLTGKLLELSELSGSSIAMFDAVDFQR